MIEQVLTTIFFSVPFSFFIVRVFMLPYRHSFFNQKPFNCVPCLSCWVTAIAMPLRQEFLIVMGGVFTAGVLGLFISEIYNKLIK